MTIDLDKLRSISIGASATPSRKPLVNRIQATEDQWDKEFPAYKRLRKDGLRPRTSKNAHIMEQRAETKAQVEGRYGDG